MIVGTSKERCKWSLTEQTRTLPLLKGIITVFRLSLPEENCNFDSGNTESGVYRDVIPMTYRRFERMQGRIYISRAFTILPYPGQVPNAHLLDNDPHFWNSPPTWGICRTDFRRRLHEGDYVFFVLPGNAHDGNGEILPQMIYGYFKIASHIDHITAYQMFPQKRMQENANPNGNIIVNADGTYNQFDNHVHENRFDQIREHYIVGDAEDSQFLEPSRIHELAHSFLPTLNEVFNAEAMGVFEVIGRRGRVLNDVQVNMLLDWLNN